ncbi:DNA helicase UvrD, partial [Candidatus Aenigmatarchaeota archaeon]
MEIISDIHLHSRFSRATSKDINIENLIKYAKIKGLNLLGTGDFTHPLWIKELKSELKDDGSGILKTSEGFPFILQAEIANIYTQDGRGRRVHNVILAPGFDVVEQINEELGKKGRMDYDGRPIFGFSCIELVDMMMGISKDIEIIPA